MSPNTTPKATKARVQLFEFLCSDMRCLRDVPEALFESGTTAVSQQGLRCKRQFGALGCVYEQWHSQSTHKVCFAAAQHWRSAGLWTRSRPPSLSASSFIPSITGTNCFGREKEPASGTLHHGAPSFAISPAFSARSNTAISSIRPSQFESLSLRPPKKHSCGALADSVTLSVSNSSVPLR